MNVADTDVIHSILQGAGFERTADEMEASVILLNTCAIREGAEQKVWGRLAELRSRKRQLQLIHKQAVARGEQSGPPMVVGVLGCMAERLKEQILESEMLVDMVVGPDAYRDLPRLLSVVESGQSAVNTMLSIDETYADITPIRMDSNGVSAYVSIMRGCENLCSYCIVPFTRGKERSRPIASIVDEVKQLRDQGFKEITLLGQNVNSYNDTSVSGRKLAATHDAPSRGFRNISRRPIERVGFAELLSRVSEVDPELRIRFTSPHPKDFPDDLLQLIAERHNICSQIHVPAQSGNSAVLERMRRGYSREAYIKLIETMRAAIPNVTFSTDVIAGFCGETESEHEDTLSLMRLVGYDQAFMFAYSQREKTYAHRHLPDDVPALVKNRRLREIIETFHAGVRERCSAELGHERLILVDSPARKSATDLTGRTDGNKRVFFTSIPVPDKPGSETFVTLKPGDYAVVRVVSASGGGTLRAEPLYRTTQAAYYGLTPAAAAPSMPGDSADLLAPPAIRVPASPAASVSVLSDSSDAHARARIEVGVRP